VGVTLACSGHTKLLKGNHSLQERLWVVEACPEKGNKTGEGSRDQVL